MEHFRKGRYADSLFDIYGNCTSIKSLADRSGDSVWSIAESGQRNSNKLTYISPQLFSHSQHHNVLTLDRTCAMVSNTWPNVLCVCNGNHPATQRSTPLPVRWPFSLPRSLQRTRLQTHLVYIVLGTSKWNLHCNFFKIYTIDFYWNNEAIINFPSIFASVVKLDYAATVLSNESEKSLRSRLLWSLVPLLGAMGSTLPTFCLQPASCRNWRKICCVIQSTSTASHKNFWNNLVSPTVRIYTTKNSTFSS